MGDVRAEGSERVVDFPRRSPRLPSGFKTARDLISFIAGMLVIGHEVFFQESIDALAVGIGGALLGLPVVFGADERRNNNKAG